MSENWRQFVFVVIMGVALWPASFFGFFGIAVFIVMSGGPSVGAPGSDDTFWLNVQIGTVFVVCTFVPWLLLGVVVYRSMGFGKSAA